MKSRNSRPAPSQSSASAPRFASFSACSANGGPPISSLSRSPTETPVQPRFGATNRRPVLSTRPGRAMAAPAVTSPSLRTAASASPASPARSPSTSSTGRPRLSPVTSARWRSPPARSAARAARKSTPSSRPSPTTPVPLSSTGSAGRPTVPRSSTSVSRTSPKSISSPTRLETVVLFSPVSCAIAARERGPRSATWRRTTPRLWRRTERWLAGARPGSCEGTARP